MYICIGSYKKIKNSLFHPAYGIAQNLKLIAVGTFLFLYSMSVFATDQPIWWGNNIGKDPIVLPGYDPITVEGQNINLGVGRSYQWKNSLLPTEIYSRHNLLVTDNKFIVRVDGRDENIKFESFVIEEQTDHHVIVVTKGTILNKLNVKIETRIEYDGVAFVDIFIDGQSPVTINKFHHIVSVKANEWTKMLAFEPESIHVRQKHVVHDPEYNGDFLNVVALVDGDKSFWWFADNAEGWSYENENVTEITKLGNIITLKQKLIDKEIRLNKSIKFKFNFLVTPVKKGNGNIRQNRFARHMTKAESEHSGVNVWWINAFSHQIFPYLDDWANLKNKFSKKDIDVYPGLKKNKTLLKKYKNIGIDRLPYFSAHMLNYKDPEYAKFKKSWEVHPRKVWNRMRYDPPFSSMRNDAYLTHRAEGYTDYLLYRFSVLIDQLGFEGLYFDQGGVVSSQNPLNGLWIDPQGKKRNSTDILALREFNKRLATLFYLKGKKGLIFIHNSNTMVFPAYTFVTSMVQGEEYIHWLKNYDYIDSVGLDEIRTRIGSSAFGIPTMWLEVIYASEQRLEKSKRPFTMSKKEWLSSEYYEKAYKNFMALALLHDMPTWSYASVKLKNAIYKLIDWVEPETAKFYGYWTFPKAIFIDGLYFSYYVSEKEDKLLVVLSNLSKKEKSISNKTLKRNITSHLNSKCRGWKVIDISNNTNLTLDYLSVSPKNFILISVQCD